ncbi:unnamed protein product, partial [Meganyctiphanes norvegica]
GSFVTLSTLHHVLKQVDNDQKLGCVVSHHTLAEPEITTVPITVYFSPAEQKFHIFNQILLHSDYEVRLNFSSNPQPKIIEWFYGANFLVMPNLIQIPSDNGKITTSIINHGNDKYQALLRIAGLTKEDFKLKFKLHIANEIG